MLFRILSILGLASLAFAGEPTLDSGNTSWMMMATALVMLMTPAGLALFYAGMTRSKNALNTTMMVFSAYALATVVWVFWAYSLAFGDDVAGIIGSLKHIFLNGIGYNDWKAAVIRVMCLLRSRELLPQLQWQLQAVV